jgi:hypothetical protein
LRSPLALAAVVALAILPAVGSGCQSTQAKSAELAKSGDKLLDTENISITHQSADVKVLSSTVLVGKDTSTVAVELENDSQTGLINVPIQIDVRDAKGKSIFKNNAAGTDPTLTSVPVIGPGAKVWWVHDQVFAPTATPASVKVQVGDAPEPFPEIPEVSVSKAKLEVDSISGSDEASGTVENKSTEDLKAVYVYAVAMKGGKVVAAGRGAIDKLKADAKKPDDYHIFFTAGDPAGAEIQVFATPTFLKE